MLHPAILTTTDRQAKNGAKLDRHEANWTAAGASVQPRLVVDPGMDPMALRSQTIAACQQQGIDHLFIFGNVPALFVMDSPDGHAPRGLVADPWLVTPDSTVSIDPTTRCLTKTYLTAFPLAATGRVTFDWLSWGQTPAPFTPDQIDGFYDAYLDKCDRYAQRGGQDYHAAMCVDDYFFGDPAHLWAVTGETHVRSLGLPLEVWPNVGGDDDGYWACYKDRPMIFGASFSGGSPFDSALYDEGGWQSWLQHDPAFLFAAMFGSYLINYIWNHPNLLIATLAGSHTIGTLYDYWEYADLSQLRKGMTWGQMARTQGRPETTWIGDPTLALDTNSIQVADLTNQYNTLASTVASLVTTVKGLSPSVIITPPTVTGTNLFADGDFNAYGAQISTWQGVRALSASWQQQNAYVDLPNAVTGIGPTPLSVPACEIQGNGFISQMVSNLTPGKALTLTFQGAYRPFYASGYLSVEVDGVSVGTFTPSSQAPIYKPAGITITPTQTSHRITIRNPQSGGSIVFINLNLS